MIKIHFDPGKLSAAKTKEWAKLIASAKEGTRKLIEEWEDFVDAAAAWRQNPVGDAPLFKPTFDDDLWIDIRNWLLTNVFNNKCAYCETQILRFVGDAEHFRPKGRVSVPVKEGKRKTKVVSIQDDSGGEVNHPGYFWLAYNWKNLLPACQICNRNGKRDLFPVGNAHRAAARLKAEDVAKLKFSDPSVRFPDMYYLDPEDLDELEGRLLLHPYFDVPSAHLEFGPDGCVNALDDIGRISIELYKLKDSDLDKARGVAQNDFFNSYMMKILTTPGDIPQKRKAAQQVIIDYIRSGRPYVLAILDYVHRHLNNSPYDLREKFLE